MSMPNLQHGEIPVHIIPVDPSLTGWSGVFRTVRESDVSKVDDCKDDIDTLLVFAGLYSAVLTTFIVESYKNLQQDPQDVMVYLMTQSFSQSYTFSGGYLNATLPPPTIPPFEAPLWAIQVNVLWFSSLILSLASSSLGILVKQWLREYLALEYTSAEQRLRARQYRAPALKEWQVFEIASALPILLQIALALFFLGLCIFTNAVHESIGRTTIPVVSAWVFLFFMTTIAPLFSPRCPFKTTFLKGIMKACRRFAIPNTLRLLQAISRCASLALTSLHARRRNPESETAGSFDGAGPSVGTVVEEDEVVKQEGGDAEVFWSVDASMVDDNLFLSMLAILQEQKQTSPLAMVQFAWRALEHRNPFLDVETTPSPLTMSKQLVLSHRVWIGLFFAVSNAFVGLMKNLSDPKDSLWVERAASFLFSNIEHRFHPDSNPRWLQAILSHSRNVKHLAPGMFRSLMVGSLAENASRQGLATYLHSILSNGVYDALCPICVIEVFKLLLRPSSDNVYGDLLTLLSAAQEDFAVRVIPQLGILTPLYDLLTRHDTRWTISSDVCRPREVEDLLVVVSYSEIGDDNKAMVALGRTTILGGTKLLFNYLCGYAALRPSHRIPQPKANRFRFKDAFRSCDPSERVRVLGSAIELCHQYCDGAFSRPRDHPKLDIVRVCQLFLETENELRLLNATEDFPSPEWYAFWESCSHALGRYLELCKERPSDNAGIAARCLDMVSGRSDSAAGSLRLERPSHPAELVSVLRRFIADSLRHTLPRTVDETYHHYDIGRLQYENTIQGPSFASPLTSSGYDDVSHIVLAEDESTDEDESMGGDSEEI